MTKTDGTLASRGNQLRRGQSSTAPRFALHWRPSTYAKVRHFCDEVLESEDLSDLQNRVLYKAPDLFESDSFVFHPRFGHSWRHDLEHFGSKGLRSDIIPRYLERGYHSDPFAPLIRDLAGHPGWRVQLSTEMLDYTAFVASQFYRELCRPNRVHYLLCMPLCMRGQQIGLAIAMRGPDRKDFSAEDRLKAEIVVPTLTAVLDGTMQRQHVDTQALALRAVCHGLVGRPVVILDDHFEPVHWNSDAERLHFLWNTMGDGGTLCIAAEIRDACCGLARESQTSRHANLCMNVRHGRAAGRSVPVRIDRHVGSSQAVYLVSADSDGGATNMFDNMRRLGLTKREMDIVVLVARGYSTPDISKALCRTINTIEAHLKSIFGKAAVHTRGELVYRLLKC